jgi:uncharacterized protein YndB with AHSA1/START domain
MTTAQAPAVDRVEISRVFPASPKEIFAAWTTTDSLRRWMGVGLDAEVAVEADIRVGGGFRIAIGGDYVITGAYREIVPPERLVFTWVSPTTRGAETLVTIRLRPQGDGTELHLTHEQLPDAEVAARHRGGWSNTFDRLEAYLSAG